MCVCVCVWTRGITLKAINSQQHNVAYHGPHYDWLNRFYTLYMADIVDIFSRHVFTTETRHRNQSNITKLVL